MHLYIHERSKQFESTHILVITHSTFHFLPFLTSPGLCPGSHRTCGPGPPPGPLPASWAWMWAACCSQPGTPPGWTGQVWGTSGWGHPPPRRRAEWQAQWLVQAHRRRGLAEPGGAAGKTRISTHIYIYIYDIQLMSATFT